MGWPIAIGMYFSPIFWLAAFGFIYPSLKILYLRYSGKDILVINSFSFVGLVKESLKSSIVFGGYTLLGLFVLAVIAGILFTLWRIAIALFT